MNYRDLSGARFGLGAHSTRREFLQSSTAFVGAVSLGGAPAWGRELRRYPIETPVLTTQERMLAFPVSLTPGLKKNELNQVSRYSEFGYGEWAYGSGLPIVTRTDLMPVGYQKPENTAKNRLLKFFSFSDVHITDKEAPNQFLLLQQTEPAAFNNTSVYSPVMLYSTQVLDAAVQTVNDLHRRDPFDFGIALGDASNSTSFNELRWYIDVIDGKPDRAEFGRASRRRQHRLSNAVPGRRSRQGYPLVSGARQPRSFHDRLVSGRCRPVRWITAILHRRSGLGGRRRAQARLRDFPALFDYGLLKAEPAVYPGVIDGASPYGAIIHAGRADDPAFKGEAPRIVADPDRRPLARADYLAEFLKTATNPKGHGFNLVDSQGGETASPATASRPNPICR